MPLDRFLIGPMDIGLQTDLKPFMLPDSAFASLNNAYVFRGRVRKRFGSSWMGMTQLSSRLRVSLQTRVALSGGVAVGITSPLGNASGFAPGGIYGVSQAFSIGPVYYTVISATPGAQPMSQTFTTTTATFDVGTGAYNFVGAPANTQIYFYPNTFVTTNGAGNASGIVPGQVFRVGQMFSIGATIYTVITAGSAQAMLKTDGTTTATYSTTDGSFNFVGAPINSQIFFYPAEPVMGFALYEIGPVNDHPAYAFDTQFAYVFSGGAWSRSQSGGIPVWHGSNSDFFWAANWEGIKDNVTNLFVSNFHVTNYNGAVAATDDPLWTFDGTTWSIFTPRFLVAGGTPTVPSTVKTARIVLAFRNRLILLNTVEVSEDGMTNFNFVNRCRFSQNGPPFDGGLPFCATAWLQTEQVGSKQAGFIDATTEEAIISAEFIKDRLIVYFERSTWELAYTGNEIQPFNWYKINTELGSEATFSIVPFDKFVLGVGQTGIHACNGANVIRTDNSIPDQVFQITNAKNGFKRVAGIRDYYVEMVYWAFPNSAQEEDDYPNKVLVYNYKNQAWAINDDTITAFGYFEQQTGTTWATAMFSWVETNNNWKSGTIQSKFRQVIAGNQEGFVFLILPDRSSNASVLQITNMTFDPTDQTMVLTIINHNIQANQETDPTESSFIRISGAQGVTFSGTGIYEVVDVDDANTIRVFLYPDLPTIPPVFTGTYTGGGTAALVSNVNFTSKQWSFYHEQGKNAAIERIDFNVLKTSAGEITVDYFPSFTQESMINEGEDTGALMGNNILDTKPYPIALAPLEQVQTQLWHTIYLQTYGETLQIAFYMTTPQLLDPKIALADFELNATIVYAQPVGRLQ